MNNKFTHILIPLAAAALTLACNLSGAVSGGLQDGLIENYKPAAGSGQNNTFTYSEEQLSTLQQYGNPTRFNIIFTQQSRDETWYYDTTGYTAAFQNGVLIAEQSYEPVYQENLYATTYTPDLFYSGMDIDAISVAAGRNSFVLTTIDGMPEESRLMHLEGLSIGLVDGKINFLETYPATTEISLSPEDFASEAPAAMEADSQDTASAGSSTSPEEPAAALDLTPAESDCAGTHNYEVVYYVDAEEVERKSTTVAINFTMTGLEWTEDGEILIFTRTEPNIYEKEDLDSWLYITFIPNGPLMLFEEESGSVEIEYSRLD